mgnify:CR=1 FL=1
MTYGHTMKPERLHRLRTVPLHHHKRKAQPILGLEGYRSIVQQMKAEGIHLPIVAIGGITLEDIPAIMQTGVTGIALSGTILRAANPVEETKKIVSQLKMNNE